MLAARPFVNRCTNEIIVKSCQKLMRVRRHRDIIALLIFIKWSSRGGVSFRITFRHPAHNENKISCLNFARIITKRRAVTPRKNTVAGYDGHPRATVTGKKQEAFLCELRQFPLFFCAKRET